MPTRIASRPATAPPRGAITSRTIGACSSADSSAVPPWASIQRFQTRLGRPVRDGRLRARPALGHVDPEIGQGEQARARVEHELGEVRRAVAAYRRERLAHLERVADGFAERLVHVGQQADDLAAGLLAEREHRLGECASVVERLHEGALPDLDVEDDRLRAGGELLRHDRGGDQRELVDRRGDVAQAVERQVGGNERRRLADDRHPDARAPARSAPRWSGRRGSRGSTRACRACRRCGRGRGRSSSRTGRRRLRRSARPRASSCPPPRPSSACRRPSGRARRRGRSSRRS